MTAKGVYVRSAYGVEQTQQVINVLREQFPTIEDDAREIEIGLSWVNIFWANYVLFDRKDKHKGSTKKVKIRHIVSGYA